MLKIVCRGKMKEHFYRNAEEEYRKRIEKFIPIEITERDAAAHHRCTYHIYLDERGEEMDSRSFSHLLKDLLLHHKTICFFIGGWEGFTERERERADRILSLSKMTFPYQLCRVVLLEQIYRALTMIKGISYQK